jgi:hypothetical protein
MRNIDHHNLSRARASLAGVLLTDRTPIPRRRCRSSPCLSAHSIYPPPLFFLPAKNIICCSLSLAFSLTMIIFSPFERTKRTRNMQAERYLLFELLSSNQILSIFVNWPPPILPAVDNLSLPLVRKSNELFSPLERRGEMIWEGHVSFSVCAIEEYTFKCDSHHACSSG